MVLLGWLNWIWNDPFMWCALIREHVWSCLCGCFVLSEQDTWVTSWCSHDLMVLIWPHDAHMTSWCSHDLMMLTWPHDAHMTSWCSHDLMVLTWPHDAHMTSWCSHDSIIRPLCFPFCICFSHNQMVWDRMMLLWDHMMLLWDRMMLLWPHCGYNSTGSHSLFNAISPSTVCHAELNAILNKNSSDVKGCTIFVALFPCNECAKLIIQSGITEIVYLSDKYHDTDQAMASRRLLNIAGVQYRCVGG